MRCLDQSEIDQWLTKRRVTSEPYGKLDSPTHYCQFKLPQRPLANAAFIREILALSEDEILVHVTDWPTYEPSEMAIVDSLRKASGESRYLIDAAGHLFTADESELAIALFGHTGNFEWNAYLYRPNDLATLYNWEGEFYDFWSENARTHATLTNLVDKFGLVHESTD